MLAPFRGSPLAIRSHITGWKLLIFESSITPGSGHQFSYTLYRAPNKILLLLKDVRKPLRADVRKPLYADVRNPLISLSSSSEEKDNLLNEMREKRGNESLTLTVKPKQFRLPFISRVKATVVLENNNNSTVCFIVGSNTPETLEIEPSTGCINPGEKVLISI
ncbi:hypothetical protein AVEN_271628-1 [Araneus ventricosus]|uniref:MSP domain-containing protein n=1 Tax=Araneus ventricosus TaxID=182803 RepID=A0A4Y2T0X0_ARAVE|nr:hypothetical protein AVEN_271628-1 [Araneus ventricosus]